MADEERKSGAVDRINDAYSAYRNFRKLQSLLKKVQLMQKAAALLATSEVWGPIAIGVGLVVLVLFTVTIILGTGSPEAGGTLPSPQNKTNIEGLLFISGGTQDEQNQIKNVFSNSFIYPGYKNLLTGAGPIYVVVNETLTYQGRCVWGLVFGREDTIQINPSGCGTRLSNDDLKYTLLHESGHIIASRNSNLYSSFPYETLVKEDGIGCYDVFRKVPITYPCSTESNTCPDSFPARKSESFAEAVSLFIYPRRQLQNFSFLCSNTRQWLKKNVFD